ncbi:hypothetical protein SPSIL_040210 [Sporomusa silvacetica DSM 10669]|uniref:Carboxymuconolactone decarboxylase-like domain-containing protein n=1 Tax=Sporomusa silvacetica DSM 10669 TaxID=1123289 RepID=A0ABZ3IPZ2_9FIRM|nr:carboxymuconolactone decarboxylase family protein [Sporomusa silvacetica]OZC16326.1 carboxymuconolactone decarboxylase family protein [Sporomusa silvacetica DSM 10669]
MKKLSWKKSMTIGVLCAGIISASQMPNIVSAQENTMDNYDRVKVSNANYERLFGDEVLPGAQNDPELAETMKRFVYGDVVEQAKLTDKQRQLVTLVVLATNQNEKLLKENVKGSLHIGVTPLELREAIYQVAPYIGFPKAFEALEVMNGVFKQEGIKLPLPKQGTVTEENRFDKGLEVQKSIYGERINKSRADSPKDQMHIQDDLAAFCFGDTYTRGSLDLKMRELLTLSVIAALGGAEPQLKGHIQGNINVGNDRETIIGAITQVMPYIGFPRTLNALRCINDVIPVK